LSMRTQGSSWRRCANSSLRRVSSFSALSKSTRARSHSSRETTLFLFFMKQSPLFGLGAQTLFLFAEFGREVLAEIFSFKDLADLDFRLLARHGIGATLQPTNGLLQRIALPDPEAGDPLLDFRERSRDHRPIVTRELDARSFRGGLQSLPGKHDTRLDQFLIKFAHLGEKLPAWHNAGLGGSACLY